MDPLGQQPKQPRYNPAWTDELNQRLDACLESHSLADGEKFSELEFIDDLAKQRDAFYPITENQKKLLNRIYTERVLGKVDPQFRRGRGW